ncbi:unnamed protein product [Cyprideis torosa]|uniref:Uncharacterized protein n=1 Tax=Cyprideis torosa TaxID=163714 RepID=A0A7R8ZLJ7_9CRUS|nr:unnamed protein product [Cyprideis torosa]CAG0883880.1 unnamed protein product [Cyprideis torosa]
MSGIVDGSPFSSIFEEDFDISPTEQLFHDNIREYTIFGLLFVCLYSVSYMVLSRFRLREKDDVLGTDEEEAMVYRISLWICTFGGATSGGAALLLPISIVANEILLMSPNSYYMKWLNSSLIQGLWNLVFLFSNLSLFIFLPFAYLFSESEGFVGSKKGLLSRVYESSVVLVLLAFLIVGVSLLLSSILDPSNVVSWKLILICTPLGFARLFTVVGDLLVRPHFIGDPEEEFLMASFEQASLRRQLTLSSTSPVMNGHGKERLRGTKEDAQPSVMRATNLLSDSDSIHELQRKIESMEPNLETLDKKRKAGPFQKTILYPLAMLVLLALTSVSALMVLGNTITLLIGVKALPKGSEQFTLGRSSLHALGWFGAALEISIIVYLFVTSLLGLYSLPGIKRIRPVRGQTPLTHLILQAGILLIISSALPLLSRIVGITNFDLIGNYGKVTWLGSFRLVFVYNLLFACCTISVLFNHFTSPVRRALYYWLIYIWETVVMLMSRAPPKDKQPVAGVPNDVSDSPPTFLKTANRGSAPSTSVKRRLSGRDSAERNS